MTPDCYGTPTVRRYPRSMVHADGAFPRTPEYAIAIDPPEPVLIGMWDDERQSPWLYLLYAVSFVGTVALCAVFAG